MLYPTLRSLKMKNTEANNTDAGKSTLEPLPHEQFLEAREPKKSADQNTLAQTNRSCLAQKKLALEI